MQIEVNVENSQTDLPLNLDSISDIISFCIKHVRVKAKSINVYFLDPELICEIHNDFFQDSSLTDCMSFPIEEKKPPFSCDLLGEIFISTKYAIEYCNINRIDPYIEVTRYIIHSTLHLCGYRDNTTEERKIMHEIQEKILEELVKKGICLK